MIAFLSTDDTGDEFAASGSDWDSLSIRHTFIRKVKHHNLHEITYFTVLCNNLSRGVLNNTFKLLSESFKTH